MFPMMTYSYLIVFCLAAFSGKTGTSQLGTHNFTVNISTHATNLAKTCSLFPTSARGHQCALLKNPQGV